MAIKPRLLIIGDPTVGHLQETMKQSNDTHEIIVIGSGGSISGEPAIALAKAAEQAGMTMQQLVMEIQEHGQVKDLLLHKNPDVKDLIKTLESVQYKPEFPEYHEDQPRRYNRKGHNNERYNNKGR